MAEHVVVVMPAYNAAETLRKTYKSLPAVVDEVIVGDDASQDDTVAVSKRLGLRTIESQVNRGYGANQKDLYDTALADKPRVVIMIHPDNQYDSSAIPAMIKAIEQGSSLVLGSRMKTARQYGMPWWKYLSNRGLTMLQNTVYRQHLSEFHTGLRAYSAELLQAMPYQTFSDNFVFDSEVIAWTVANKYKVSEVDCKCFYNDEVSSIRFGASVRYGLATLGVLWRFRRGGYR